MWRATFLFAVIAGVFGCGGESGATSTSTDSSTASDTTVPVDDTGIAVDTATTPDTSVTEGGCKPSCDGAACAADDGCGGKCKAGSCPKGFLCSGYLPALPPPGRPVQCEVAGNWQITITSGSIPKDRGWDVSNDPDPFVCVTFDGVRECTSAPMNTRTPTWSYKLTPRKFAPLDPPPNVEMLDDDGAATAPDVICPKGPVAITRDNFLTGKWGASCSTAGMPADIVMSFEATLTAL